MIFFRKTLVPVSVILMAVSAVGAQDAITKATTQKRKPKAYKVWRADNRIDEFVNAKLKQLGIPPSERCTDEVFVRRAYLDVIGTLPRPREVTDFLYDSRADKRNLLIEELLGRDEFADYWTLKWCDLLRVKSEFPSNLWPNAVQAYQRWLQTSIKNNKPYDQFVRELLTSCGSNFRVAPVNFYRAVPNRKPIGLCQTAALTFMGIRPDGLSKEQWLGMTPFFASIGFKKTAEWKEEIVFCDPSKKALDPKTKQPITPTFPDGKTVNLTPMDDPRVVFADWLISAENPWFAQNIVNRVWYWLLGRGLINEPDDVRPDNPPQNPELLDYLAEELIKNDYDLRHIYRLILNSETYQRSAVYNSENLTDEVNFSHYLVRRLDAEVLIDAICQITGTTESYSSAIPEPFTWIPDRERSIKLADGSITSSFLELYGRPPRDTGYELERNNTPSPAQKLHLLNSSHIQKKLQAAMKRLLSADGNGGKKKGWVSPAEIIDRAYLAILSRYPTEEEQELALGYMLDSGLKRWAAANDLIWALINTKEFAYRH
ncbi:DUF1553 domain-containing protein [Verrucomicrobiota bacterium]